MPSMSKADRNELRRIVRTRIQLLDKALKQREQEIQIAVRERVVAEGKDAVERAAVECQKQQAKLQAAVDEANMKFAKLGVSPYGNESNGVFSLSSYGIHYLAPIGQEERIQDEIRRLKAERGQGSLNLATLKLELEEELAIGALESEEAREFLARIPKLDEILPSPDEVRQLNGGKE